MNKVQLQKAWNKIELPDGEGFWVRVYTKGGPSFYGPAAIDGEFILIETASTYINNYASNRDEVVYIHCENIIALARIEP